MESAGEERSGGCRNTDLKDADFWKNKIRVLEDDASLQGRLQILKYLRIRQPHLKLNVLEVLKQRRCGILRFMVDQGLVKLDHAADSIIMENASTFQFLTKGRIPSSMSTRCSFCFAAVEYDDLQSLEWLC